MTIESAVAALGVKDIIICGHSHCGAMKVSLQPEMVALLIIWKMVVGWQQYRLMAVAQVSYFVWVSLATVLQLSITAMNWGRP